MDINLAALPDDVATLQQLVRSFAAERTTLSAAQAEIARLDQDQMQLGLEDLGGDIARVEATLPPAPAKAAKIQSQIDRPSMPAHLPREEMRIDIAQQACPCCGGELHRIGETVSERLDHVPARLRVIRICRPRYGCRAARLYRKRGLEGASGQKIGPSHQAAH